MKLASSLVSEIRRLHIEILGAARASVGKAIDIGKLLHQQKKALAHGEWQQWLEENIPFSHDTARNYMLCFDRRDELRAKFRNVRNLSDAYKLLRAPDSTAVHYSSKTPEWETPDELFETLNKEFDFELDVCATKSNAKCKRFLDVDALCREWNGRCWMNPPYGQEIGKWIAKAYEAAKEGATVVCLLPARVDTGWWWDYCRFGEMRFLRGRLKFGNGDNSAPFPSVVVIFPRKPRVIWWEGWNDK